MDKNKIKNYSQKHVTINKKKKIVCEKMKKIIQIIWFETMHDVEIKNSFHILEKKIL